MSRTMNLTPKTAFECAPARNPGRAAAPPNSRPSINKIFRPWCWATPQSAARQGGKKNRRPDRVLHA